ncbi:MAG: C10 family peptidase, partial [candidate division Zixibacteria bacterium]|nr:C10 family peptidase [candidate division Zixibacteria bacterium]
MAKTGHFRAALTVSILLGALVTAPLQGEVATIGEANLVAANWLTYVSNRADGWDGDFSPTVTATDNLMWGDTLLARIYSVSPRGHVLVPVLKEIKPVKVYSVTSHFDVNQTHSFVQMLREILIFQVRLFVDSYGSMEASQPRSGEVIFLREARELWDRYAVSEKEFAKTLARSALAPETVVGPLLTDMWHQLYPYNMYCPMGDGGQCVVGCGATAISQVMHYWRCPPKGLGGLGSHSYWWNGDTSCGGHTDGQQLSADFTNSLDWDIMPDTLNAASPEESKEAVAELCYEVGISVNMDYGYCGSGCYMSPIPYAMKTYFRYLDAMSTRPRTSYTPITWFNLIKNEINNGRPILYGITSHLMVCDGW